MPTPKVWEASPLPSPGDVSALTARWSALPTPTALAEDSGAFGSASNARSSVASPRGISGTNKGYLRPRLRTSGDPAIFFGATKAICGQNLYKVRILYSFGVTYFKTTLYTYWMYILHNEHCLKFSSFTLFHPIETGFYHVFLAKIIAGNYEYVNHRQNGQTLLQMQCPGVECQLSVGFSCPFSSGSAVKTWWKPG